MFNIIVCMIRTPNGQSKIDMQALNMFILNYHLNHIILSIELKIGHTFWSHICLDQSKNTSIDKICNRCGTIKDKGVKVKKVIVPN